MYIYSFFVFKDLKIKLFYKNLGTLIFHFLHRIFFLQNLILTNNFFWIKFIEITRLSLVMVSVVNILFLQFLIEDFESIDEEYLSHFIISLFESIPNAPT